MIKKKLNNKGVTLIELIVSFALVAVAIIYFYQTLITVNKLYKESSEDTLHYTKVNYATRIISAAYDNEMTDEEVISKSCSLLTGYIYNDGEDCNINIDGGDPFTEITFSVDEKNYKLYKYFKEES